MTRVVGKLDDTTSGLLTRSAGQIATSVKVVPMPSLTDLKGVLVNVRTAVIQVASAPAIIPINHSSYPSIQYPLIFPPVFSGTGKATSVTVTAAVAVAVAGYVFSDPNNSYNLALI